MRKTNHYDPRAYSQPGGYSQQYVYSKPNAFISGLLAFIAVVFMCFFIFLMVLRAGNITNMIRNNVPEIIRNTDIIGIITSSEESNYIAHQVYNFQFNNNVDMTLYDFEYFIKSDAVTDELSGIVDGYVRAFAAGDHEYHLTTDDIIEISKNLEPEMKLLFDYQMTEEDYDYLARTLDDIIDLRSLNVGYIVEEIDVDLTIPFLLLSPYLFWGIGILCAGLLLVIFLRRRRFIPDAALAVGVPIMISGMISFAIGFMLSSSPPEVLGETVRMVLEFLADPAHLIMRYGFIFAATGVVVVVVSTVFKSIAPRGRVS